jgi:hypothetical protein
MKEMKGPFPLEPFPALLFFLHPAIRRAAAGSI